MLDLRARIEFVIEDWEMDEATDQMLEFDEEIFRERTEGEGPPDLSPEELGVLDAKAVIEEVERLRGLGVI